ncbi:serine carboxypeptidase S28, partial [Ancylostoma caninum]
LESFRLVPPWNEDTIVTDVDVQFFFQSLYGIYQAPIQAGMQRQACSVMTDRGRTPLENMVELNRLVIATWQGKDFNGTENSYEDLVKFIKEAHKYGPEAASVKLWIWQTCTEFGYFQSSDSGYTIFGSAAPVNLYTRVCVDVFGDMYKAVVIDKSIRKTNELYGGRDNYEGTNAMATNGDVDPWHALGMYKSHNPSVITFLMEGAAHCNDLFQPQMVNLDIVTAQTMMDKNVKKWMEQDVSSPRPRPTPTPRPTTEKTTSTPRPATTTPTRKISIQTEPTTISPTTTSKMANYDGFIFAIFCSLVTVFWL